MADKDTSQDDHAYLVLADAPCSRPTKERAWDEFYAARNAQELASRLNQIPELPESVKVALIAARRNIEPSQHEQVINAIHELSRLDPKILEVAEKHPNLLKHLLASRRDSDE
jgi:hypothetical protein